MKKKESWKTRTIGIALASAALLAGRAEAQLCAGPDGLNGPCWDPAFAQIPDLEDFDLPAAGICWDACNPVKDEARIRFSPPAPTICGQYRSQVIVSTPFGPPVLGGTATLDYTRTWAEKGFGPVDVEYQVWRFALKVDFFDEGSTVPVCYRPPCIGPAPAWDTCFWYGYVDYALNCFTGEVENAVALFHNCDDYVHNPFFSDRPAPVGGGFHPTSMYAVVAPDTAVNPFVPAILTPRSGDLFAEAVRNVDNLLTPGACTFEDPIEQGLLGLIGTACLCPITFTPPMQSASRLQGSTACGSSFLSLKFWNPQIGLKWWELIGTSLGTWTTPDAYPGEEAPFAEEGLFLYVDSCAQNAGLPAETLDFFYGAKTIGGFEVLPDPGGSELTQDFLDVASNYSRTSVVLPFCGSVRPTDHLIYANVGP